MESPHPRKIRGQFYQVLGDPKFSRTSGGGLLKFVKFSTRFSEGVGVQGKTFVEVFCLFQNKFNSTKNIFIRVLSCHQK